MAGLDVKVSQLGEVVVASDNDLLNLVTYDEQNQTYVSGKVKTSTLKSYMVDDLKVSDLYDTTITTPTDDDGLVYDATAQKWKNIPIVTQIKGAGAHNSIYRGKSLGSSVTADQYTTIASGNFDGLYIGDYWTIPTTINGTTKNVNYRIAAFDYFLNCGDTDTTTHHVVLVPDAPLYFASMNDSNVTTGGYMGSKMYTDNLAKAKTGIKAAFGTSHILSHRVYLSNAVTNGYTSGGAWADSDIELMCEQMVYGSGVFSPVSTGSVNPANYRVEKSQLPLFALNPNFIANREYWWIRDVITSALFALIHGYGYTDAGGASASRGVRPAFCICA